MTVTYNPMKQIYKKIILVWLVLVPSFAFTRFIIWPLIFPDFTHDVMFFSAVLPLPFLMLGTWLTIRIFKRDETLI